MKYWIKIGIVCLGMMAILGESTALAIEASMGELTIANSADYIVLSTTLALPFEGKLKETIHSGIDTTFVFRLELLRERPLWFDEEIFSKEITHTVKYDTLSKQYALHVSDMNNEQSLITTTLEEMKRWMTSLEGIRLVPVGDIKAGEKYYIRVMAEMEAMDIPFPLDYILFFVPFQEFETPWAISPLTTIQQKK